MLVHVKAKKSLQRQKQPILSRGKILCSFKPPSNNANGHHLKEIYERQPVEINGNYCIQLSWDGRAHKPFVYFEPVPEILKVKIDPLFYYCNNIHQRLPAFFSWWTSVCTPPQHSLQRNQLIYVQNVDKYTKVSVTYCI